MSHPILTSFTCGIILVGLYWVSTCRITVGMLLHMVQDLAQVKNTIEISIINNIQHTLRIFCCFPLLESQDLVMDYSYQISILYMSFHMCSLEFKYNQTQKKSKSRSGKAQTHNMHVSVALDFNENAKLICILLIKFKAWQK